jgi:hypothetical protein
MRFAPDGVGFVAIAADTVDAVPLSDAGVASDATAVNGRDASLAN